MKSVWGLALLSFGLTGCSQLPPAKYKGWQGGDAYFYEVSKQKTSEVSKDSSAKSSSSSLCASPHQVQKGENLSLIAKRCGLALKDIIEQNHLVSPYVLYPGQDLELPQSQHSKMVRKVSKEQKTGRSSGNFVAPKGSHKFKSVWLFPVKDKNSVKFLKDRQGRTKLVVGPQLLLSAKAVQEGKVVYASNQLPQFGQMVIVEHPSRLMSVYAHLDAILVKKGEHIRVGTPIGLWVPHGEEIPAELKGYVEARYRGRRIDILPLFKKKP